MKAFTLLCGLLFIGCGSGPELFPTSSTTGQTTTASGGGQGGDGGAPTTTTDSTTAMAGGGGMGGAATTSTTTTATTTTTTTTTVTVGSGGAGGAPVDGCDPPSFYGDDCTLNKECGDVPNYPHGAAMCDAICGPKNLMGIGDVVPDEFSWIFTPVDQPFCYRGCGWSFVTQIPGPGCIRATTSPGLLVSTAFDDQHFCGSDNKGQCVSAKAKSVNPVDQLHLMVTAEPGAGVGWVRIETTPTVGGACNLPCP